MSENAETVTAAMLVIGDEILSGRTQDTNFAYIAKFLGALGIDLCEGRIVPDVENEIVAAVNALRGRYTYVFTSGGIGPTHDDITADSIAKAFGVGISHHPEAMAMLDARYKPGEFNEMRQRMARIPHTASLIRNSVSTAPGFQIGNVFVMAGVPMVFQAMLEDVAPRLKRGAQVVSATISARVAEGRIAAALARIQTAHRTVAIGSYPFYREDGFGVQLVVRGRDPEAVETVARALEAAVRAEGAEPQRL
ncbi:MAG: competence/damage-inducible protein A [Alphaproteobacteria bacterium]|nr:competence/damage-inducible protein A [Alphaproteobacteria bacterium]MBU6471134.1 competence/damage-inducible protein A [Alphaproteobacteria bacterium]MDE2013292.1 competence/damage-inducible protein A [Alphaproteobacteria bacterium]MDE2075201.1 competence/damage-inducible protein A [Alphaproteobacteria bacterium]